MPEPIYKTIVTDVGLAAITNAVSQGGKVDFLKMLIGDGGGFDTAPTAADTALVNQVYSAVVVSVAQDANNPNYIVVDAVIPASVGGWDIREAAIVDAGGAFLTVANVPTVYKPILTEGAARDMTMRLIVEVSNASVITLQVNTEIQLTPSFGSGSDCSLMVTFPPAGLWNEGTIRPTTNQVRGFLNDGDYFLLRFDGTIGDTDVSYYSNTGSLIWTKTAGNLGAEFLVGFMLDDVEGFLYLLSANNSSEFLLHTIDSAGASTLRTTIPGTPTTSAERSTFGWFQLNASYVGACSITRATLGSGNIVITANGLNTLNGQLMVIDQAWGLVSSVYEPNKQTRFLAGAAPLIDYPDIYLRVRMGRAFGAVGAAGYNFQFTDYRVADSPVMIPIETALDNARIGLPHAVSDSGYMSVIQVGEDYLVGHINHTTTTSNNVTSSYGQSRFNKILWNQQAEKLLKLHKVIE